MAPLIILIVGLLVILIAVVGKKIQRKKGSAGEQDNQSEGGTSVDWNKLGGNIAVWLIVPFIIACALFIFPGLIVKIFSSIKLILGSLLLLFCIGLYALSRKAWFPNSMKGIAWAYGLAIPVLIISMIYGDSSISGTQDTPASLANKNESSKDNSGNVNPKRPVAYLAKTVIAPTKGWSEWLKPPRDKWFDITPDTPKKKYRLRVKDIRGNEFDLDEDDYEDLGDIRNPAYQFRSREGKPIKVYLYVGYD